MQNNACRLVLTACSQEDSVDEDDDDMFLDDDFDEFDDFEEVRTKIRFVDVTYNLHNEIQLSCGV